MNQPTIFTEKIGFQSEAARKKRFGQYFTGMALAKLLAALCNAREAKSIIDPMAGIGDMLAACLEIGATPAVLGAIEIDPAALTQCAQRLPSCESVLGNAFDARLSVELSQKNWDLVITNPPYVRYQSFSRNSNNVIKLPNAMEVRNELMLLINDLPALNNEDKVLFRRLVTNYSGLADLAVPSWILCASFVRFGGSLAMVVPGAWLSRDYALIIQYLLMRWFKIEFIVEDIHATWFNDALVKTTLLVAKRIHRRASAFDWHEDEGFLHIRLYGGAINSYGLVGNIFPGQQNPEDLFSVQARRWLHERVNIQQSLFETQWVSLARTSRNLQRTCSDKNWLPLLEKNSSTTELKCTDVFSLPLELDNWLGNRPVSASFTTLKELGVFVGQGLRTGANSFFYVDFLNESVEDAIIAPDKIFGIDRVTAPRSCMLPVLRKQSELPVGYVVESEKLKGRVLSLQNLALPEDIDLCDKTKALLNQLDQGIYKPMPPSLADLVRKATTINFGTKEDSKHIWELSAVAPNIRKIHKNNLNSMPRFWYMLPNFAHRHKPDLFVARVNYGMPKTYINKGRNALIDANFSTIWLEEGSALNIFGLLALLNSSWCRAALELTASVLGGGALKVEASHLRRLPIPCLNTIEWNKLISFGKQLMCSSGVTAYKIITNIDIVLTHHFFGSNLTQKKLQELQSVIDICLTRRSKKV